MTIDRGRGDQHYSVTYEFRSARFSSNQKHLKSAKNEDRFGAPESNSYENCVLLVKVPFAFTNVFFSSWKVNDSSHTESDRHDFLPAEWTSYCQGLPHGQSLDCLKLARAIEYYCRCYLVERIRTRVFSEEDRQANSISFK